MNRAPLSDKDPESLWPELGDMPAEEFRSAMHRIADWVADYRANIERLAISPDVLPGQIGARLPALPPGEPESFGDIFRDFEQIIMPGLVQWGHPAFLGYFGSTTTAPGILGEMLTAPLNVSAMTWSTSPAATELEALVLDWQRQMLGLSDHFTGVVYDTASVAVLHALATARESLGIEARARGLCGRAELPALRVYISDQAHSSIEKAAITLGLGARNVRRVPTDAHYRMGIAELRATIDADLRASLRPMAIVATIGTTSTASIDPLPEIVALCREHRIWLHIDAAYGGALGLLPELRHLLHGVDAADSVVVNAHKWLFVPLDFSTLYVRRPELLKATFSLTAEYLRGDAERAELNYMDYGIQLGRRFRALKAWIVIRSLGSRGLAARIREHIRLARLFASWLDADRRFEVLTPVSMAVVCFRLREANEKNGSTTDGDDANRQLVESVVRTGETYFTQTSLHGRIWMRVAVGNVLTTERHLWKVYQLIGEKAARMFAR